MAAGFGNRMHPVTLETPKPQMCIRDSIFTVGSDWKGQFDYLNEYCKVIYLERTDGVSSSDLRAKERSTRMGFVGETSVFRKYFEESAYVNGIQQTCI